MANNIFPERCPVCGTKNEGWKFCPTCGAALDSGRGAEGQLTEEERALLKDYWYFVRRDGKIIIAKVKNKNIVVAKLPDKVAEIKPEAFYRCESLSIVTIPKSIEKIGRYAFTYIDNEKITNVQISDLAAWCRAKIEGYVFHRPDSEDKSIHFFLKGNEITDLVIPEGITEINSYAFEYSSIVSVKIPEGVTKIGEYAFYYCNSLTSIKIPKSLTEIGGCAFSGCENLSGVYISDLTAWFKIKVTESDNPLYNGAHLYLNGKEVTNLTIPEGITEIGDSVFYGCGSLTSVTIPKSVKKIGGKAFCHCKNLTSVTIPDSVTEIGEGAFSGCSLTSVTIPDSVTEIGEGAFSGCSLTSATIPKGITKIGDSVFYGCGSLTSVTIPKSVKKIGGGAFSRCSLTSVMIPDSVTEIGEYAFRGSSLTSVTIPKNVKKIERGMFYDCKNLTSVTIPEGVTEIGEDAFAGCAVLTSIVIPDSVEFIGEGAFGKGGEYHEGAPCGLKILYLGSKSLLPDETLRGYCRLPEDCKIIRKTQNHIDRSEANVETAKTVEASGRYKYEVYCPACGFSLKRTRRTALVEKPQEYWCSMCKIPLKSREIPMKR